MKRDNGKIVFNALGVICSPNIKKKNALTVAVSLACL